MGPAQIIRAVQIVGGVVAAALAALVIWSISAYQAQSTLDARYRAQDRAERAGESIERACGGAEPGALVECVAEEIKATREDQRAEYDLSAQNRMAEWAFWMMVVTAITAALTAVALWFIKGTLDATREAVLEAKKGSDAAVSMAVAAREQFLAERRPWMAQRSLEAVDPAENMEFAFKVKFENAGASPAFDVAVVFALSVDDYSFTHIETAYQIFLKSRMASHRGGAVIFPGDHHTVTNHLQFSRRELRKREAVLAKRQVKTEAFSPRVFYAVFYRSPFKDENGERPIHHAGGFFSLHGWKGSIQVGAPNLPDKISMVAQKTTADFLVS